MSDKSSGISGNWRSSRLCSVGACVEICDTGRVILIRDSKTANSASHPVLRMSYEDFATFRFEVLNQPRSGHTSQVQWQATGARTKLAAKDHAVILDFNAREWAAFTRGLAAGEFSPRVISSPAA